MDMFLILSTYINKAYTWKNINVIFASIHLDVVMAICHVPSTMSLQETTSHYMGILLNILYLKFSKLFEFHINVDKGFFQQKNIVLVNTLNNIFINMHTLFK